MHAMGHLFIIYVVGPMYFEIVRLIDEIDLVLSYSLRTLRMHIS